MQDRLRDDVALAGRDRQAYQDDAVTQAKSAMVCGRVLRARRRKFAWSRSAENITIQLEEGSRYQMDVVKWLRAAAVAGGRGGEFADRINQAADEIEQLRAEKNNSGASPRWLPEPKAALSDPVLNHQDFSVASLHHQDFAPATWSE